MSNGPIGTFFDPDSLCLSSTFLDAVFPLPFADSLSPELCDFFSDVFLATSGVADDALFALPTFFFCVDDVVVVVVAVVVVVVEDVGEDAGEDLLAEPPLLFFFLLVCLGDKGILLFRKTTFFFVWEPDDDFASDVAEWVRATPFRRSVDLVVVVVVVVGGSCLESFCLDPFLLLLPFVVVAFAVSFVKVPPSASASAPEITPPFEALVFFCGDDPFAATMVGSSSSRLVLVGILLDLDSTFFL